MAAHDRDPGRRTTSNAGGIDTGFIEFVAKSVLEGLQQIELNPSLPRSCRKRETTSPGIRDSISIPTTRQQRPNFWFFRKPPEMRIYPCGSPKFNPDDRAYLLRPLGRLVGRFGRDQHQMCIEQSLVDFRGVITSDQIPDSSMRLPASCSTMWRAASLSSGVPTHIPIRGKPASNGPFLVSPVRIFQLFH